MLGFTSGFINGFNREWWSTKHNTHHVMTNHVGVDLDIDLMPTLFLLAPPACGRFWSKSVRTRQD